MNTKPVIKVRDVMSDRFAEMDGLATVSEALTRIREQDLNVILISRRDEHDAHGIVLLADIAKKVLAADRAPERVNLYEIMSKPVISVEPSLNVRYCARLFHRFGLSVAPVIENDQILGIVTYRDLVLKGLL
ncbi:CBS domain-containing protein [Hahella sp. SMD15-11]|uniref:CBS domain-containing protein n=1 Tax=Thermohahella caldifontis TaxID=3142973 RepID=A0AB39UT91_9GAMM